MSARHGRRQFSMVTVWLSVGVILVGALVVALGVALLSWWVAAAGAAVALVGGVLARAGGIMSDVRVKGPQDRLVRLPDTGPGAEDVDSISPYAAEAGHRPVVETGDLAPVAAVAAAAAGVWLALGQFFLYPASETGQETVLRDRFLGVLIVLAALPQVRSRAWRKGPWLTTVLTASVVAVSALLSGSGHEVKVNELVVAGVVLVTALVQAWSGRGAEPLNRPGAGSPARPRPRPSRH